MISAMDVARYFLSFTNEEREETLTNLKLQKLLYYAQGFFLGAQKRPLFPEQIEAWEHGPVVREIYHIFSDYKGNPIPKPVDDAPSLPFFVQNILNDVYVTRGKFDAWRLRDMTHQEAPWIEAFSKGRDTPLDLKTMQTFFREEFNKVNGLTEEDREAVLWSEVLASV